MSCDTWFSGDVERVLNAIEETATCFPPSQFRIGWMRCLAAVRAGFGISHGLWSEGDGQDAAVVAVTIAVFRAEDMAEILEEMFPTMKDILEDYEIIAKAVGIGPEDDEYISRARAILARVAENRTA